MKNMFSKSSMVMAVNTAAAVIYLSESVKRLGARRTERKKKSNWQRRGRNAFSGNIRQLRSRLDEAYQQMQKGQFCYAVYDADCVMREAVKRILRYGNGYVSDDLLENLKTCERRRLFGEDTELLRKMYEVYHICSREQRTLKQEKYLNYKTEMFSAVVGESALSVLDLAAGYKALADAMQEKLNEQIKVIGIQFSDVVIENISLPEEVEKLIDEQSGIGIAKGNMESFVQYQTARAMRDAAQQEGGLAGLGAGLAFGNTIVQNVQSISNSDNPSKSKIEQLRELKGLLDDGILTQEEFDAEKKRILGN